MITNQTERNAIATKIETAKNGKRRGHGSAFRTDYMRAAWLANGERAVGVVGGKANMAIHMPAGSRTPGECEKIAFYGASGVLSHEEAANEENIAWFNAAYKRAA